MRTLSSSTTASCFNPTVVRLKGPSPVTPYVGGNGFNPTVVRLKGTHARQEARGLGEFQSHCGAIKSQLYALVYTCQVRFNPTVVRLKADPIWRAAGGRAAFQSHCGAIKSCPGCTNAGWEGRVSIPLWCD